MSKKNKNKKSKRHPYTIEFNIKDTKSFYDDAAVLPAAAVWNFDEFLMVYISAGVDRLLHVSTGCPPVVDSAASDTVKKLKKASKLARRYASSKLEDRYPEDAERALRLLIKVGIDRLWN